MSNNKEVVINNRKYVNLRSACLLLGLNYNTIYSRIKKGMSIEDAINTPVQVSSNPNEVVIKGKPFSSGVSACNFYGINRSKVYRIMERENVSFEVAINKIIDGDYGEESSKYFLTKRFEVTINGILFKSLADAYSHYGVSKDSTREFRALGYSHEESINMVLEKKGECGKGYNNQNSYNTKYNAKAVSFNGVDYESVTAMCKDYNVSPIEYYKRLKRGWTMEQALEVAPRSTKVISKIKPTVFGRQFQTVKEACDYYGVSTVTYRGRRRKGYSEEESLGLVPRCVNGIIDKKQWNFSNNTNDTGVTIQCSIGNMYKCIENGALRYFSKRELFEKFEEARLNV